MHSLDVVCFERPFRFSRSAMRRFAETEKARVVIAEVDNRILAGFVILHLENAGVERIGYVVTLDVSPTHRCQGIAGQLMQEAKQVALRENCAALVLHVFTGNEPAIRFYQGHGFVRFHREADFYGPAKDAWVFQKSFRSTHEE
jgi:ribosomal-protein-alanine N-acetyltransferase